VRELDDKLQLRRAVHTFPSVVLALADCSGASLVSTDTYQSGASVSVQGHGPASQHVFVRFFAVNVRLAIDDLERFRNTCKLFNGAGRLFFLEEKATRSWLEGQADTGLYSQLGFVALPGSENSRVLPAIVS